MIPTRLHSNKYVNWVENKYVRLVLTVITLATGTVIYYGWQHFQFFLEDSNYLDNLCPPDTTEYPCDEQQYAWDLGYTLASTMEFSVAVIAGYMFDNIGPFITGCVGVLLFQTSWIIISMSGNNKYGWLGGMAMNGISVNLTAFPSFFLIDLFPPKHKVLMAAVTLGSQVTATGIMPILYSVSKSFHPQISLGRLMIRYCLILVLPFSIVYLMSLPFDRKHLKREYERKGLVFQEKKRPDWKTFFKLLVSLDYIVFTIWYSLMICQYNYYGTELSSLAGDDVSNIVGWLFFLQGPMAIAFGHLNDIITTIPACLILTAMQTYSYGCITQGSGGAYFSGVMYVLSNAHVFTTKYAFAGELYPQEHYGKLSGLTGLVSGLLQLINNPIRKVKIDEGTMFFIYTVMTVVEFSLLAWIGVRIFVKKVTYCPKEPIDSGILSIAKSRSNDSVTSLMSNTEEQHSISLEEGVQRQSMNQKQIRT